MNPTTRVFISYSHDTSEHRAFVLALANRLRGEGLDCQIDQYVNGFPPEGWQRWLETQIEQADFVLIVCTSVYLQRYRGQALDGGRGVNFESVVISQMLYDQYYRNNKFIPVIPEQGSLDDVQLPLKGFTTYKLPQDYTALYRLLTGQHAIPAPEIGGMIYLPPETASGLALNVNIAQQAVQVASYTNLPDAAVQTLVAQLEKQLSEEKRNNHNLSDLLERYRSDVAEWESKYRDALVQNAADLQKNPENPQLLAEQQALQAGELEQAAQIRERYYQNLKREKTAELAQEAYTAAERWENAFNMTKALEFYREATRFKPDYFSAWRNISNLAKKMGDFSLALQAAQDLQAQLEPEKDAWWLATALIDEGDALNALGNNETALEKYWQGRTLLSRLVQAEPGDLKLLSGFSASHDRVGDMYWKTGDNTAALKAYQDGLAIAKRLVDLDPNHLEWQRDLSVSYNKVGDTHLQKGEDEAALKSYQDGLVIAKKLVELDSKRAKWQRDLFVSHVKIGDIHLLNGNKIVALKAYQDGFAIAKRLVDLAPDVVEWQTDLVSCYFRLTQILPERQEELLTDALAILYRLQREKRLDHEKQQWIGTWEKLLQPVSSGRDESSVEAAKP
ncbi:SEFIR domain-containing protein [Nitrosomonas oligotropha]|uniref:SEFIR domain-containing protein n=1 Tax=Nitrosomonas oligotropha TaxID=42354 RepID=A0A2T5HY92_9PROT|nr:SEFIR domain-containing protein [Nitrosomonas oligotropha]PTQ76555.1 SEFIR domain-containing protein [Nitrosomonas oligotropha]